MQTYAGSATPGKTWRKESCHCSQPFRHMEVSTTGHRGNVFLCCPSWLPVSIGSLETQSVTEIWNSKAAREVRESILDGSFRFCSDKCPFLQTQTGPVGARDVVSDERQRLAIDRGLVELPWGPEVINAAFDRSCNLSCPSCRSDHIIEVEAESDISRFQGILESQAFGQLKLLYVTGSGDPFGSPFLFRWLRNLDVSRAPQLRIHLHSNALLWTKERWEKIPWSVRERIVSCEISIDAASEPTYQLNRRGGSWNQLLLNLDLIRNLRANGHLTHFKIHMVVQENNFTEMADFVELGSRLKCDVVYFSCLLDWNAMPREEYLRRAIAEPDHPRHADLVKVLQSPALLDPIVDLGNLRDVRLGNDSALRHQHRTNERVIQMAVGNG